MFKQIVSIATALALLPISGALGETSDASRTQAVSALNLLVYRKASILNGMMRDQEDGGDIIIACVSEVFSQWGPPVYQSIVASPDAHDEAMMNQYINVMDKQTKTMKIISSYRKDLPGLVKSALTEMQAAGKAVKPAADLSFLNFQSHDQSYIQALSICGNQELLDSVANAAVPVDPDAEINGAEIVNSSELDLGNFGASTESIHGMIGIVPSSSGGGVHLVITDKSATFSKKRTYSDWIDALSRN